MGNAARIRICHEARRGGVALAVFIMRKSWVFSDDGRVCRHDKRDGWCVGSFGAGQHRSCRLAHYHRDTRTRDTCPDTVTLAGDGYPCHYQTLVWDILGWVCFHTNWDIILGVGYYSRITHTHSCIFLDRVEMLFSFWANSILPCACVR